MTRSQFEHECRHALAGAVGVQVLAAARYGDATCTIKVSHTEASCLIEIGDIADSLGDRHLSKRVMSLAAIGPCARSDDALRYLRNSQWQELAEVGELSEADVTLLQDSDLPGLAMSCARTIAACQALQRHLRLAGWTRLTRLVRDWSATGLGPMPLETLAPQRAVRMALEEGDRVLERVVDSRSDGERAVARIVERTRAQQEVKG